MALDINHQTNNLEIGGAAITTDPTSGSIALVPKPTSGVPNPVGLVLTNDGVIKTVTSTGGVVTDSEIATASSSGPDLPVAGLGSYGAVNSSGTAASATGAAGAIAIGEDAKAPGQREIVIGPQAGNTTGSYQGVSIGYYAGRHNRGNYSVAIGPDAMGNSTNYSGHSGEGNIAIGRKAMTTNTGASGNYNVAIGSGDASYGVLGRITSGYQNVAIGYKAGSLVTTAYGCTLVGDQAGYAITTGRFNTIIGRNSGSNVNTGIQNIIIGSNSGVSASGEGTALVIGTSMTSKGTLTGFIAGLSGVYNQGNSASWATTSDERIKTNITGYTTGLSVLNQVNVKTYNYLSDEAIAAAHPELAGADGLVHEGLDTEKTIVGIMAQELETVLPSSVTTRDNGIKSVNKDELFWVMLNSIKELKTANDLLAARVEALESV